MAKKSNFLKNLLTTASTLAVLTGGVQVAEAVVVQTGGTPAVVVAGGSPNLLAFVDNVDTIQLNGAHNLITGGAVNLSTGVIDINGNNNQTFTVGHVVNYAGQDLDMNLVVNVGGAITVGNILAGGGNNNVVVNAGALTVGNISGNLTVAGGAVAAAGTVAGNLAVTGGAINAIGNITGNVSVDTGTVTAGAATVNGTVGVVNGGLFATTGNVGNTVTINTANAGMNRVGNTVNTVLLTAGKLTMGNHGTAGNITVTAGELTMGNSTFGDLLVNGGQVVQAGTISGNVAVDAGVITQVGNITGTIGVVNGGRIVNAGNAGNTVTINTTSADMNIIGDAANAVTLTAGKLTMGNHGTAGNITVTAGELTMGNSTFGDLLVNGGQVVQAGTISGNVAVDAGVITQVGNITGTIGVVNGGRIVNAGNAGNIVTINTTSADMNIIGDAANAVTLTAGKLTMGNHGTAGNITVTAGELTMGNSTFGDLLVNGGQVVQAGTISGNVAVDAGVITQVGNITGTIGVVNGGRIVNAGNAGNIVTINTTSADMNIIGDAANAVTLTAGKLTMGNHGTAGNITVTAGELTMGNSTFGDLLVNGGQVVQAGTISGNVAVDAGVITQVGNITGTIGVVNGGRIVNAGNAGNIVTINTTSADMNIIGDAANAVTLTAGKLTMGDATGANVVTVNAGDLIVNGITNGAGDILVDGAAATAHVLNNVGRHATVANGGKLAVTGNIGGKINGAGEVSLIGAGNTVAEVGDLAAVTKLIIAADRTFTHATFNVTELNFADNAKVDLTVADLAATNVTLDNDGNHHIEVHAAQNITGAINATDKAGFDIKVMGNAPLAIGVNTANFKADLFAETTDTVTANIGNAFVSGRKLGSQTARFLATNFDNLAEVTVGDIYSKDITVQAARKVKFAGKVVGDNLCLAALDSQAKFANGATLASKIIATVPGEGLVEFEGAATLNEVIGVAGASVKSVKFSAAAPAAGQLPAIAQLNKDIYSTTIDGGNTALYAKSNSTLHGETTATYLGADAGKVLTFADGELKLAGNVGIKTEVTESGGVLTAGKIVVDSSATLDVTGVTNALVVIDDSTVATPVDGRKFTLFQNQNVTDAITGAFQDINVKTANQQSLVKWTGVADNKGNIVVSQYDNAAKVLTEALGNGNSDDITNMNVLIKEPGIRAELQKMTTAEAQSDLIKRAPTTNIMPTVLSGATREVSDNLGVRLTGLSTMSSPVQNKIKTSDAGSTGISAGDEASRYGVWLSPIFNKSTQKSRKGDSGYTASTGGASFGFDTKANDDMIVGLALSLLNTEVKHKDFKSGDKTKADSLMFSIYGMQQITDAWFAQGLVTFGSNRVTTNEKRRVSDTEYQRASGKYTSMSFSGEALVGYNHVMEQMSITPMGGVRLTRVNDGGYKETGTTNQNLTISRKAANKAELVLGAKVAGSTFDLNGLSVTPGTHAFLNQDMIGKNAKVDMKLPGGGQLVDKSAKPSKTLFNAGVSLGAVYNSMEYGLGYDAYMANKYIGHQGTLKVRVNF